MLCGCVLLAGCATSRPPTPAKTAIPTDFKGRQKYLLREMDANAVYAACQHLLRDKKAGRLSDSTYYCDDPPTKWNELPEGIRNIEPTSIFVMELGLDMKFASPDGGQTLECLTSDFQRRVPEPDGRKGSGTRMNPLRFEAITGKETLDYLDATYDVFSIELRPGLTYRTARDTPPHSLEEMKLPGKAINENNATRWALKRQRLLYQTDHQELLRACRDALRDFNSGGFHNARFFTHGPLGDACAFQDVNRLPEPIMRLQPIYVWFEKDRVMVSIVALTKGLTGVEAYAEGAMPVGTDHKLGLIDGLWYCDDGLAGGDREYRAYLKSLEKEVTTPIEYRRKHPGSGTP